MATKMGAQSHFKYKIKNKKPNARLNILDEGYPLNNENIAQIDRRL